ncbi:hypothetical protein EVAR_26689_1 [Eumeta japonica]|uniref:Uncharacterized protein n=1 Tax=Eumeta variegata TaxID=151549 RepID=A0A4C1VKT8_EUMVA|nr:hypothetical protein EVAR_26689_1 [Eumeta japonica]
MEWSNFRISSESSPRRVLDISVYNGIFSVIQMILSSQFCNHAVKGCPPATCLSQVSGRGPKPSSMTVARDENGRDRRLNVSHGPTAPSIKYPIHTREAGNALLTLEMRVFMGDSDHSWLA